MADQVQKTPDLEFTTRDDLIFDIEFKNEDGTPKDLTGWTGEWIFKRSLNSTPAAGTVVLDAVVDALTGKMTFDMSREINLLQHGSWYSQLRVIEPGGDNGLRTTLASGTVKVNACLFED